VFDSDAAAFVVQLLTRPANTGAMQRALSLSAVVAIVAGIILGIIDRKHLL
jgi:hypothetical protein